jgi:SAM-dependent methyltransferase
MATTDERNVRARGIVEQAAVSDNSGEHSVRDPLHDYDAELSLHNEWLRSAMRVGPDDRVLDIGCGTGQSTRDAARAAQSGHAVGVDVSAPVLERARQLSDEAGIYNVSYVRADAQIHPFPPQHFDVGISRFGTMFFTDPVAAFTNIGRALRPTARLVLMVWQDRDRNEWASAIREALAAGRAMPAPPERNPDPFSLGDPATLRDILWSAGFTEVEFTDVNEPVYYGQDSAAALDFVSGFLMTKEMLTGLDDATKERYVERLRATLVEHERDDGVWFDSRAWIVAARRGTIS